MHDEGTWRVLDATLAPDGSLSGRIEATLTRGTTIDRGDAAPGAKVAQDIAITADGLTFVAGERWFAVTSERCA